MLCIKGHGTNQEDDVSSDGSGTTFKHLLYTEQDNYTKITLNRPAKMNALNTDVSITNRLLDFVLQFRD